MTSPLSQMLFPKTAEEAKTQLLIAEQVWWATSSFSGQMEAAIHRAAEGYAKGLRQLLREVYHDPDEITRWEAEEQQRKDRWEQEQAAAAERVTPEWQENHQRSLDWGGYNGRWRKMVAHLLGRKPK
jgi:hypothetical protein